MLTPEQLQQVRSYAWDRLLRARKVNVDGKVWAMKITNVLCYFSVVAIIILRPSTRLTRSF